MTLNEAKQLLENNGYTLLREGIIDNIGAKLGSKLSNGRLTETDIKAFGHLSKIEKYVMENVPFVINKKRYWIELSDGLQVQLCSDIKNHRFFLADGTNWINVRDNYSTDIVDRKNYYPVYKNVTYLLRAPKPNLNALYGILDNWQQIKAWLNDEVIPELKEASAEDGEDETTKKGSVSNFKL